MRTARLIWLEPRVVDRPRALRGHSETYSDVTLRLAGNKNPAQQRRGAVKSTITGRALHGGRAGDGKDRSAPRRYQTQMAERRSTPTHQG